VILARRKGKQWFIAGINGENMEKVFELDLSFLSNQATEATLLHDSRSKGGFKHDNISFSPTAPYRLSVQEYGGFVLIVE
jgi:alpha-glucosidase